MKNYFIILNQTVDDEKQKSQNSGWFKIITFWIIIDKVKL